MRTKPPPDIAIDQSLVRTLLREQHADLAHLPLIAIGEGWDNSMYRLGDALAVRLSSLALVHRLDLFSDADRAACFRQCLAIGGENK
jgi:hypothetical protein